MQLGPFRRLVAAFGIGLGIALPLAAQPAQGVLREPTRDPLVEARELRAWIERIQAASLQRNYAGTFVLSSPMGSSTSRLLHITQGAEVYELVELLDGLKRTQIRHNGVVHTVMPDLRLAMVEKREFNDSFPRLLRSDQMRVAPVYDVRLLGEDRVAGHMAQVVHLRPRDALRFGLRIWAEEKSGLLLKSQVLAASGEVLEQVAFSDLQLNVAAQPERIKAALKRAESYKLQRLTPERADAQAEGWRLNPQWSTRLPGFRELGCWRRPLVSDFKPEPIPRRVLQWVFSDGLAHVSMFVEPYQREQHQREGMLAMGATHSLTQRHGDWWVTVLGEVPAATLQLFAQSLERLPR
jgi:sigma-E factor negative regulatory protein RseB